VDADTLFARTRLPGTPDPVVRTDTSSDESHDYYYKLMRHAERATHIGDTVRAAILHTKAARVAPVELEQQTRNAARTDLERFTARLYDALKFPPEEGKEWLEVLPDLLDKADQGPWPVEAKLLSDLQNACIANERKLFQLDLVEWGLSGGKRSIKRPIPSLQMVRTNRFLRSAQQRLTMARVSAEDRQRLAQLLHQALHHSEQRLRNQFRPILQGAFQDVGLVAANPTERVALRKMIEELLDRIARDGFFTFSDLRDVVSRNQLKLPDLEDPHAFWWGDPLLLLDRRLAPLLEGVYRRGEFYLRWLESLSSLCAGTSLGRFLTRNLVLPFGGSYALLKGIELVILEPFKAGFSLLAGITFLPLGLFLLALMHIPALRQACIQAAKQVGQGLRTAFYDVPRALWAMPWFRRLRLSWGFLLLYWYVLKPLAVWGLLCLIWPKPFATQPVGLVTFFGALLLLNSRLGHAVSEAVSEAVVLAYSWVRFDALEGLFRVISFFFKQVIHTVELVLYTVDEWLRFRGGETRLTMFLRLVLGVVWFPIGFLIRLYFVALVEPSINPIKFPISSIAFKFLLLIPLYRNLMIPNSDEWNSLTVQLTAMMGEVLAVVMMFVVIWPTLWLLGSAVAFLLWEMLENWRLFRANRPARLKAVMIGGHGETMLQLLRPGFHSGTVPKLYSRLRQAERTAYRTGNWRSARANRQGLKEVAESVQLFVEREFLALLSQAACWQDVAARVSRIELSCTRIRIELDRPGFDRPPVQLAFEERGGRLIGTLQNLGWIDQLTPEQLRVLKLALTGLYKIAGVTLIAPPLESLLAPEAQDTAIIEKDRLLGKDRWLGPEITVAPRAEAETNGPPRHNGQATAGFRLEPLELTSFQVPLTWQEWFESWGKYQRPEPLAA
jgi:hypothetical protein